MTLDKLLNISETQFPPLWYSNNKITYQIREFWELNENIVI